MVLSNLQIGLIVMGTILGLLALGGLVWLIVWLIRRKPSVSRLPAPVGSMTATAGPYPDLNGIQGTTGSGHIDEARYRDIDVYGKYGWRAVTVKSGIIDETKTSAITWNNLLYTVFLVDNKMDSGFTFKLPKQTGELVGAGVEYQLMGTFYDNADASGTPLYEELVLGKVVASASPLLIVESDDSDKNKVLKSV